MAGGKEELWAIDVLHVGALGEGSDNSGRKEEEMGGIGVLNKGGNRRHWKERGVE